MILKYVYVVTVDLLNEHAVRKSIEKRKVVKTTTKFVVVDNYGQTVRVDNDRCFATKEEAERECESRSNELISKLTMRIQELKKPVTAPDEVKGFYDQNDPPEE